MTALKRLVTILTILVILIPASGFGYIYYKLGTIHVNDSTTAGITENSSYKQVNGISNVLLVGIDARNLNEQSRSDSMMILTIDNVHKSIKLTSLARDSYVDIPGHGRQKLTHAYALGGINTLLETVEQNLELDIDGYAIVNFYSFVDIIDTLGGIEVTVDPHELKEVNKYIPESYAFDKSTDKGPMEYVSSTGTQTLKGYQALSYSRIRKSDSAYARDERQREVMQSIAKKASDMPVTKYPEMLNTILPYVKTNFTPTQMLNLGFTVYKIGNFDIKQLEFPILEFSTGGNLGSAGWVLQWDPNTSLPILHRFIYDDIMYEGTNK